MRKRREVTFMVKNHTLVDGRLTRLVVWTHHKNTWAPVSSVDRNGQPESTSYQVVKQGDLMLVCEHLNEQTKKMTLERVENILSSETKGYHQITYDNLIVSTNVTEDISGVLISTTDTIINWLRSAGDRMTNNYLPPGVGWDGTNTTYDLVKRSNIRSILEGCDERLLDTLVDAGQRSPASQVPTRWEDSEPLGKEVVVPVGSSGLETFIIETNDKGWVSTNTYISTKEEIIVPVAPDTVKLVAGSLNEGEDRYRPLVRWKLYSNI